MLGAPWSIEFGLTAAIIAIFLAMSFFSVSWLIRIRTCLAIAVGAFVMGYLAWPMVKPFYPGSAVSFFQGDISTPEAVILVVLAFIVGFVGYFASYPYGTRIALLAVPAGMCVWSFRGGAMSDLLRLNHTFEDRLSVYSALRWEGVYWLLLALAGALGVMVASFIIQPRGMKRVEDDQINFKKENITQIAIAFFVGIVVVHVAMMLLIQDVRMYDQELKTVIGQPEKAQIAFGVLVAFGLAAFLIKLFLKMSYIIPALGSALYVFVGYKFSARPDVIEYMAAQWPVSFYPMAVAGVLPIEIVSYGVIGSITGYWIAIKYDQWRKEEAAANNSNSE